MSISVVLSNSSAGPFDLEVFPTSNKNWKMVKTQFNHGFPLELVCHMFFCDGRIWRADTRILLIPHRHCIGAVIENGF